MKSYTIALCFALIVASAYGDMYMQNPRGSNDRNREANTNRDNGNRLFDSQNNGKGGYCWGPAMEYYAGSMLSIQWTNQHACGGEGAYKKADCEIVIQYACTGKDVGGETQIRDGIVTTTIPDDINTYMQTEADGEYTYGMHESYDYYQSCKTRSRNQGLYIADRNVGNTARNTRQNNNGNRRGFECPEERDYYPYWGPSMWRDVAVLTTNTDRCEYYQEESQNVKDKYECRTGNGDPATQVSKQECTAAGNSWKKTKSHGIDAPDCDEAPSTRDNHLGNGNDGIASNYNWTMPDADELPCIDKGNNGDCTCVLRTRYNISTTDFNGWKTDSTKNAGNAPLSQDPYVSVDGLNLSLAVDTSQFARTFQDRTHVWHIKQRPDETPDTARLYNLNVRGKRGNIVQTYPATEYDFTPNLLRVREGDSIHFQWTGCDTNPAGNAGEGTDQTDRSNIVQLKTLNDNTPDPNPETPLFKDPKVRKSFLWLNQENCQTLEELEAENEDDDDVDRDPQNCMKLNAAGPYFDGGIIRMDDTGEYHYMSSRNNNWTNRGQKASIIVDPVLPLWALVLIAIAGAVFLGAAGTFGAMMYGKSHPHSKVAEIFENF